MALRLAREIPGGEVTKALAEELGRLPPVKQRLLVAALSDRGDPAAGPAVLRLSAAADTKTRAAALSALGRLGDPCVVSDLVTAAASSESEVSRAAMGALANYPDKSADAVLVGFLQAPEAKLRRVAVEALGQRRSKDAAVVRAAADSDESVRVAAIKAIGNTQSLENVAVLAGLLAKAKESGERTAVEGAIGAVTTRMPDRESCAEVVLKVLPQAEGETKASILRALARIGGAKSLVAIAAAVRDADENVASAALRLLAEWPDPAAAPELVQVAKTTKDPTRRILALRGYLRLTSQGDQPADRKLASCREAFLLAQRDEEKILILGVLGGIASVDSLTTVVSHLDSAALKEEASAAAVAIGEKLAGSHPARVAEAMRQVLKAVQNADVRRRATDLLGRTGGK